MVLGARASVSLTPQPIIEVLLSHIQILSFFFLFRFERLPSATPFDNGAASLNPMAIFNIVRVANNINFTQNAGKSRLEILAVTTGLHTSNIQTLSSAVLFLTMETLSSEVNSF